MSRNLPPLNWLRAFEASARHLSFTQAAAELHLTQAAISKQVKLLEQYLGQPMFVRGPRSLELTKSGEAYLPKLRDAFERLEAGTVELFDRRRNAALTVRVSFGFSVNWLGPRLGDFLTRHPETRLRVITSVWNEEEGSEKFDLDIIYGNGRWDGLRTDRLTWETITPVCSPLLLGGHVPGAPALKEPADLVRHRLLHVLGYEQGWGNWLTCAGVAKSHIGPSLHFDTSLVAFEVAATGHGVALGRSSMIGAELASGRLVAPFALRMPIDEAFYLAGPLSGAEHPDAGKFRSWIVEQAKLHHEAG